MSPCSDSIAFISSPILMILIQNMNDNKILAKFKLNVTLTLKWPWPSRSNYCILLKLLFLCYWWIDSFILGKNMLNNSSTCDLENVLDRHLENVLDRQGQLVEFFLNCHNFVIYLQIWFIFKQNNTYDKTNMFNYWSMTLTLKMTITVRSTY